MFLCIVLIEKTDSFGESFSLCLTCVCCLLDSIGDGGEH